MWALGDDADHGSAGDFTVGRHHLHEAGVLQQLDDLIGVHHREPVVVALVLPTEPFVVGVRRVGEDLVDQENPAAWSEDSAISAAPSARSLQWCIVLTAHTASLS